MNIVVGGAVSARAKELALGALLGLAILLAGCRGRSSADEADPAALFRQMRQLHATRRYRQLESMIWPQRAGVLIDTLMAVDRLIDGSERLRRVVAERLGDSAAFAVTLGQLRNFLGPFSRDVEVVSVNRSDGRATVVYQVRDALPLRRAEMRLQAGRWYYVPDEPQAGLLQLIRRLTEEVESLTQQVLDGTLDKPAFLRAYRQRVIERLSRYAAEQGGSQGS